MAFSPEDSTTHRLGGRYPEEAHQPHADTGCLGLPADETRHVLDRYRMESVSGRYAVILRVGHGATDRKNYPEASAHDGPKHTDGDICRFRFGTRTDSPPADQ